MSIANFILKSVSPKSLFDDMSSIVGTASFNQGDFVYINGSGVVHAQTSGDTGASFLGMATQTVVSGVIASAYTTENTIVDNKISGPAYGVIANCTLKTGVSFTKGCLVYPDTTTTRGVTSASAGLTAIGIYQGATVASATALQQAPVLLGQTYGGSLTF